jgi:uncharacterized protein (TIGR02246 family)
MRVRIPLLLAVSVAITGAAHAPAQTKPPAGPATAVCAMLNDSVAAWNRGDIDAFATSYKNSPDILFIGKTVSHGYAQMLAAYKKHYATREQMGVLSFAQLQVQPLDARFATVTGNFHLERTPAGGGNADGYFLLVVEKTSAGWKIVRDDSTATAPEK